MLHVGSGLIADFAVFDAAQQVRAFENFEAAVFAGRPIDGDQATRQLREQAAVVIPVAIVLVPFPSAAGPRLFENQLVMIVIGFAAEEPLHRVDNAAAADERARDVVAERVFDGESDCTPLTIAPAGGKLIVGMLEAGDFSEQLDFLGVEQPFDDKKAVFMEPTNLLIADGELTHGEARDAADDDRFELRPRWCWGCCACGKPHG